MREEKMKSDSPYGLHIWASLLALGPIALCTVSFVNDWPIWARVTTSIFAAAIVFIHFSMVRGATVTPFNGRVTALGFLIQMALLVVILLLSAGPIRGILGMILLFANLTNFGILKRAVNGLPDITPDNRKGE
jgi:hypothetical protein